MRKTYQYRIYPNIHQKALLTKNLEYCQYVYHTYLKKQIKRAKQGQPMLTYSECLKDSKRLRQKDQRLKNANAKSLAYTLKFLTHICFSQIRSKKKDNNHLNGLAIERYPYVYQTCIQIKHLDLIRNCIKVPRLGHVKAKISRIPVEKILSAIIVQKKENEFFLSICCVVPKKDKPSLNKKKMVIYLPQDIEYLFEDADFIKKTTCRLQKLQKSLSRKCKDSKNFGKEKRQLEKLQQQLQNQKKDLLHKQSTKWVETYNCIEIIESRKKQNSNASSPVYELFSEADKNELLRQLNYKLKWKANGNGLSIIYA